MVSVAGGALLNLDSYEFNASINHEEAKVAEGIGLSNWPAVQNSHEAILGMKYDEENIDIKV